MATFRKITVVVRVLTILYSATGHVLFHTEDQMADCLLASIGKLTSNTIRIRIEVEDSTIRRSSEDTVSRFLAKNNAILVDMDSQETCSIFNRIFFVDSVKSLKSLVDRQRSRECDTSGGSLYYFVVLPASLLLGNNQRTVKKILYLCWKAYILNVNVLIENENKGVTLYTYYPFTKFNCHDSTPTIHNRFINGSFEWNKELFPPKMDNLWQCPIKAIIWDFVPFIWVENKQIYGLNGLIFKTLATMMNFSIEIVMSPEGRGTFYPNNSVTGASKLLQDNLGDIILGASGCTTDRRTHFDSTVSFYTGCFYAVVRRPKLYRSLDVLFLPFDRLTWISLFAIVFAKWISKVLWKKFGNRCVAFRYCSTRLHTMAWLCAMVIVRSSYEGSIFRFLQNRPIQWAPQNIDEAIDNRYNFFASTYWNAILQQFSKLKYHLVVRNASGQTILESLTADKEKQAFIGSDIFLSRFNNDPSIYEEFSVIPTPISMINYCMEMQKYSFLTEAVNTRIHLLLVNGYMQQNYVDHVQMDNLLERGIHNERASISLDHINGMFILLAMSTFGSILVFIAELLTGAYPWLKKLVELFD